jgi:transposase
MFNYKIKVMNYQNYLGIDVSKATLDVHLIDNEGSSVEQSCITNDSKSLKTLLNCWTRQKKIQLQSTLICLEPTGHYSNITIGTLVELNIAVWLANPIDIKNSIGLQRGKNDQIDAHRIAQYAYRFKDKARLITVEDLIRIELQQLLSQRELLVKDKAKYAAQINDFKDKLTPEAYTVIKKANQSLVNQLQKAIKIVEMKLEQMIHGITEMNRQYELIQTVPGVGKVLAQTLVVLTNGFTRYNSSKSLACHAGIAPFEYKSGSSVRSKNRVSHRSNKRLKSLLHMAALASIRTPGDLKEYYLRKTAQGKSKMAVLNAIRNKILHRVFAVLKRNSPYCLEIS